MNKILHALFSLQTNTIVVYICASLSNHLIYLKLQQKLLLLKAEQIHKMTTIFTQNDDFFFQTMTENKFISLACNNNYFCLSLR